MPFAYARRERVKARVDREAERAVRAGEIVRQLAALAEELAVMGKDPHSVTLRTTAVAAAQDAAQAARSAAGVVGHHAALAARIQHRADLVGARVAALVDRASRDCAQTTSEFVLQNTPRRSHPVTRAITSDAEQAKTCSMCDGVVKARGLCNAHYKSERKAGRLPQVIRPHGMSLPEAFLWYQTTPIPEDECWTWQGGSFDKDGYGLFAYGAGSAMRAHRASYLIHNGDIPEGMMVRHTCDNPPCVNPDHLILGTNEDNMQDAHDRRRFVHGEKHPGGKLTEDDVREIRRLLETGRSMKSIARQFGVSDCPIRQIAKGKTWKHVQ